MEGPKRQLAGPQRVLLAPRGLGKTSRETLGPPYESGVSVGARRASEAIGRGTEAAGRFWGVKEKK